MKPSLFDSNVDILDNNEINNINADFELHDSKILINNLNFQVDRSIIKANITINDIDQLDSIKFSGSIDDSKIISSDFIVGFPNESDYDFQLTMDLINEIEFDASFSFIYSARPGTPASQLEDSIPLQQKKERLYILQKRIDELQLSYSNELVQTIQRCLVTGVSKKDIKLATPNWSVDVDNLVTQLEALVTAITKMTHPTGVGPSGPPINIADFAKILTEIKLMKQ